MKGGKAYIISASHISAQEPFCGIEKFAPIPMEGAMVNCKDPDFKPFIPPMAARRMSSILRRCIAISKYVLEKASITCPDAIITGSGNGCVADTDSFLRQMITEKELMLNPSKFIFSTPNTMGSQIAIALGCHGFNSTHVNDGFAFEGALLDAMLLLGKGKVENVLLCAADQMADGLYHLVNRESLWKVLPASEGTIGFVCSSDSSGAVCQIDDILVTRDNPSWELDRFLSSNGLSWRDIDIVVTSDLPDEKRDRFPFLPEGTQRLTYKQYCGQFLAAPAFGLFFCSELIRTSNKPLRILLAGKSRDSYSFTLTSSLCTN